MGDYFLTNRKSMIPVMQYVRKLGYVFLEGKTSFRSLGEKLASELKVPYIRAQVYIPREASKTKVRLLLEQALSKARRYGAVSVIVQGYAPLLKQVKAWSENINTMDFVSISYLIQNPNVYKEKPLSLSSLVSDATLVMKKNKA